jgi:LmbE family N-acetylglucosaminyl deacetylase
LEGGADLVLFSAHGDDEHLFFAGLLPTYAEERGYRVQVVYLTDHRNDT